MNIQLVDRNGYATSNQGTLTVTNASATTATYTITGVSPGQYYLYFNDTTAADNVAPDYYGDGGADNITKGTVVTVPATGGTQSLTAETLTAGAIITGAVTDANAASESASHVTAEPNSAASVSDPMLGRRCGRGERRHLHDPQSAGGRLLAAVLRHRNRLPSLRRMGRRHRSHL